MPAFAWTDSPLCVFAAITCPSAAASGVAVSGEIEIPSVLETVGVSEAGNVVTADNAADSVGSMALIEA